MLTKKKSLLADVSAHRKMVCMASCVLLIIAYKVWLLMFYGVNYADDDQCLMWYGTAMFARGTIPEPCFFGQAYGAMIESFLAVPFYWIGIPLNIALPLATTIFTTLPIIIMLYFMQDDFCIVLTTYIFLTMSYAMDVLLMVPRNLVMGICITTLACIGLIETKNSWKCYIFSVAACVGIVITNSALIILGIAGIYLLYRDKLKNMLIYVGGALIAVLYWLFIQWFYNENPDYKLHGGLTFSYSLNQLKDSGSVIIAMMKEMSVFSLWWLVVIVCVLVYLYGIVNRRWDYMLPLTVGIVGFVAFMGVSKVKDYSAGVLFSQVRMFLFLPYAVCLIPYIADKRRINCRFIPTKNLDKIKKFGILFFLFLTLTLLLLKANQIIDNVENNGDLTYTGVISVGRIDDFMNENIQILEDARRENVDWIISMNGSRMEAYALGAQGYGRYHFYNANYDRRTWEYAAASEVYSGNGRKWMLLWRDQDTYTYDICISDNESIISYLYENYGFTRK